MLYRLAAELTVLLHFCFILFVIFGALVAWKRPLLKYLHWAALAYGLLVEIFYWYCPLTVLEQYFREKGGLAGYERSFLTYYLERLIYWDVPRWVLIAAAAVVVASNVGFYLHVARRRGGRAAGSR